MMDISSMAEAVDLASKNAKAITQLSANKDFSLDEAYAIQKKSMERRIARGERFIGVKMGFTSVAKMEQMGVHDLIFGILTDDMLITDGQETSFSKYIHPRAEPEIAFRASKDITCELSMDELKDYVDGIASAIELIDSRYENFKFSLADVLADNCSAAGFVIGPWQDKEKDISDLALSLSINGQIKQKGSSKAILDDPWKSLQHASRLANQYGWTIPAGSIILAGAATPAEFLAEGDDVTVEVDGLGPVSFKMGQ